ncbi:arylsulfatase B-like [Schistocerca piceifrons]|uniref:arylsulfatase B-like n=1 Tax=Schistocerca piceifrons TaxID=274613 RepID=UPI001F5E8F57|nr:arylsulfatase B-like [Schistocerca piceifrons]
MTRSQPSPTGSTAAPEPEADSSCSPVPEADSRCSLVPESDTDNPPEPAVTSLTLGRRMRPWACLGLVLWVAALLVIYPLAVMPASASPTADDADSRPHIIFIMADDLGFNDVGFHGSNQIPTPNIDALAYAGVILNRYYVTAICTPSRSALMTGKHPIHTGMQHTVLFGAEPRGLPLSERLLPQYLQGLGYRTHIVGKWHLGHYRRVYTPTYRGFESHLGFWTGHHDYNDHTAVEQEYWGLDMRRGMEPAWDLHGQYSTDVFTSEAVRLIQSHNASRPLFLYVAHAAVHSGNAYNLLPAPDKTIMKFDNIADYNRRRFAGILSKLDDSVGEIVDALSKAEMLNNSIIIFSTDNGGPAAGFNGNAASNWPLRGVKNTLWEGGVRGAGLIWSPLLSKPKRVSTHMMHITDWLPTLYAAAGGDVSNLGDIDGINVWESLSDDTPSNRTQVLHNIDDIYGNAALTDGDWKLVKGTTYDGAWDGWYGPSGRENAPAAYDVGQVLGSKAGRVLYRGGYLTTRTEVLTVRTSALVTCNPSGSTSNVTINCKPLEAPCLFNIQSDPCEKRNLADRHPEIVQRLESILKTINATAVPPGNLPYDPRADPRFWDHTWTNFGDYSILNNAVS